MAALFDTHSTAAAMTGAATPAWGTATPACQITKGNAGAGAHLALAGGSVR